MQHLPIPDKLQGNIEYHYYPSGHMVYANEESLKMLHDDVARLHPPEPITREGNARQGKARRGKVVRCAAPSHFRTALLSCSLSAV